MINYGVIVGRFQVNSLHAGHLELFRQVSEKHDRVIVFIGVPRTVPTKRNPLDFETRKKMIQADYPDFVILPLRDEKHDNYWSNRLDDSIASVTQFTGDVTLYGGRDSFVPHYYGTH
jgi:bifunctional NMN adenylyltransferase/nudix hydrolase